MYADKKIYRGQWQEDLYHGIGVLRTPSGASYNGAWKHGVHLLTVLCILETFLIACNMVRRNVFISERNQNYFENSYLYLLRF